MDNARRRPKKEEKLEKFVVAFAVVAVTLASCRVMGEEEDREGALPGAPSKFLSPVTTRDIYRDV